MADKRTSYRYNPLRQDIICAETAIDELPRTLDGLGCGRAMITCGPTILRACNVVPRVQEALGQRYAGTYSGVAAPLSGGDRGGRRGNGQGGAAGRVHQRRRRQHPRHH